MKKRKVLKILDGMVEDQLELDDVSSRRDVDLMELGADSLDRVELVMAVENRFGLDIPEGVEDQLRTIEEICDYVLDPGSGVIREKVLETRLRQVFDERADCGWRRDRDTTWVMSKDVFVRTVKLLIEEERDVD